MNLDDGNSLIHLAEIADYLAYRQRIVAFNASMIARRNQLAPVAAALAASPFKRPMLSESPIQQNPKKQRTDEGPSKDDVRFREYQAEIWMEKYEDLCAFRKCNGHCHVPHTYQDNPPLAQWVKRQRYQYKLKMEGKRSTLTDDRVKTLDQIGFIWSSHDAVWEQRLSELAQYKRTHNNCFVPSSYQDNPQLAVWVKRQRRQYKFYCEGKPASLTPERIAKLEKVGFAWDCRKSKGGDQESQTSSEPPNETRLATQVQARNQAQDVSQIPSNIIFSRLALPSFQQQTRPVAHYTLSAVQQAMAARAVHSSLNPAFIGGHPLCEFMSFSRQFHQS
jgi:hypothetical protein